MRKAIRLVILMVAIIVLTALTGVHTIKVEAKEYEIDSAEFNIEILENGDAIVDEQWILSYIGDFHRFYRDIFKDTTEVERFKGIEDIGVSDDNEARYMITDSGDKYTITWHKEVHGGTHIYNAKYRINGLCKLTGDKDRVVLTHRIIGLNFEKQINSLTINIKCRNNNTLELRHCNLNVTSEQLPKGGLKIQTGNTQGLVKISVATSSEQFDTDSLTYIPLEELRQGEEQEEKRERTQIVFVLTLGVILCIIIIALIKNTALLLFILISGSILIWKIDGLSISLIMFILVMTSLIYFSTGNKINRTIKRNIRHNRNHYIQLLEKYLNEGKHSLEIIALGGKTLQPDKIFIALLFSDYKHIRIHNNSLYIDKTHTCKPLLDEFKKLAVSEEVYKDNKTWYEFSLYKILKGLYVGQGYNEFIQHMSDIFKMYVNKTKDETNTVYKQECKEIVYYIIKYMNKKVNIVDFIEKVVRLGTVDNLDLFNLLINKVDDYNDINKLSVSQETFNTYEIIHTISHNQYNVLGGYISTTKNGYRITDFEIDDFIEEYEKSTKNNTISTGSSCSSCSSCSGCGGGGAD